MKRIKNKSLDQLDQAINDLWPKLAHGVEVSVMDIPKIFAEIAQATSQGQDLTNLQPALLACIAKYRKN